MRHYRLDGDGRVLGEFAAPQEGIETVAIAAPRPGAHHRWDGAAWVEDIDALRAAAAARLVAMIDRVGSRVLDLYPRGEVDGWPLKRLAAAAVLAGGALGPAEQALVDRETAWTGETQEAWAAAVGAKVAPFAALAGDLAGIRRKALAAIAAAAEEATVEAALAEAEADLEARWAAFLAGG